MKLNKLFLSMMMLGATSLANAQIFEATGVGDTPEMAKKDAVSNAIKFSVGEFLVNKEELTNDDFSQTIVSHSNAYVEKIDVVSSKKLESGEYQAKVKVDIESQKLIGALKEMQVAVLDDAIDNKALLEVMNHFDKKDINKQNQIDFEKLVEELIIKPIVENKAIYSLAIKDKLKPLKPKEGADLYPFEITLKITPNREYIEGFKRVLKQAESSSNYQIYPIVDLSKTTNIHDILNIATESNSPNHYKVSKEKMNFIRKRLGDVLYRRPPNFSGKDYGFIKIGLINKDNDIYKTISFCNQNIACFLMIKNKEYRISHGAYGSIPYFKLIDFLPIGTAEIKTKIYLSKDDVVELKRIQAQFSNR